MTAAQHLIENVIYAMKYHMEINTDINTKYTKCALDEAKEMAEHIVYSLYDGLFPGDTEIDRYSAEKPIVASVYPRGVKVEYYKCPNCQEEVSLDKKPSFCSECGKKLDWR